MFEKKLLKILGKSEDSIEFVEDRPGHDRRYALDTTKIENELGFKPEIDFNEGLKETVEWYRMSFRPSEMSGEI